MHSEFLNSIFFSQLFDSFLILRKLQTDFIKINDYLYY
jgi:hypothetical protein